MNFKDIVYRILRPRNHPGSTILAYPNYGYSPFYRLNDQFNQVTQEYD